MTQTPLSRRLRAHLGAKLVIAFSETTYFTIFYFLLQRYPLRETGRFELGAVDRLADFEPNWIWAYVSLYLLLPLPFFLNTSRKGVTRHLQTMLIVSNVAFVVFALVPVACPRPEDTSAANWLYRAITAIDHERNAFPSLHCALAAATMLFAQRTVLRGSPRSGLLALAGWIWVTLICWSTLATKQHYFADVVSGVALAAVTHAIVWRGRDAD